MAKKPPTLLRLFRPLRLSDGPSVGKSALPSPVVESSSAEASPPPRSAPVPPSKPRKPSVVIDLDVPTPLLGI